MINKRISWALTIAGMMVISTTDIQAQWVDRETLFKSLMGNRAISQVNAAPVPLNEGPSARAQAWDSAAAPENNPQKRAIVGSWLETVTVEEPGGRTFKSVGTFSEEGGMAFSDQGNVTTTPPMVFSAAHGSWVHLGGRTFAWTVLELISDLEGNLLGTLKIRGEYSVNESGNQYSGRFLAEAADTTGNPIFSVEGTNAGQRILIEPLP